MVVKFISKLNQLFCDYRMIPRKQREYLENASIGYDEMLKRASIVSQRVPMNGANKVVEEPMTPERMVELVHHFNDKGFMLDQGGGIAVRVPERREILYTPIDVQKERFEVEDLYVESLDGGNVMNKPEHPGKIPASPHGLLKKTGANCVIHTHSKYSVLLSKLIADENFVISDQEMICGIHNRTNGLENFDFTDVITVPILPGDQNPLGPKIRAKLHEHPTTSAVLVRGHGVFCFGFGISWQRTKMMLECYEYLFEMACMMINSGIPLTTRDPNEPIMKKEKSCECDSDDECDDADEEMGGKKMSVTNRQTTCNVADSVSRKHVTKLLVTGNAM